MRLVVLTAMAHGQGGARRSQRVRCAQREARLGYKPVAPGSDRRSEKHLELGRQEPGGERERGNGGSGGETANVLEG